MDTITLKIDGVEVTVPKGYTVLQAAHEAAIKIPTLCFLKEINEIGACRMCLVEVKGSPKLAAACVFPAADGMEVYTNTPRIIENRKKTLELILSNHRKECLSCVRSGKCELQQLCQEYGIEVHAWVENFYVGTQNDVPVVKNHPDWIMYNDDGTIYQRNEGGDRLLFATEKGCRRGQRPQTRGRCEL